ncbi:MAG TPA: hypothetical protein VF332_13800, partial [Vicinamibacterales bacterium]
GGIRVSQSAWPSRASGPVCTCGAGLAHGRSALLACSRLPGIPRRPTACRAAAAAHFEPARCRTIVSSD